MKRMDLVEKIFDVKREKNLTWKGIAEEIGGYSQLYICLLYTSPSPRD